VLPVYGPVAIWALEPPGRWRVAMLLFVVLGAVVSVLLLAAMVRGPVTARLGDYHLSYGIYMHARLVIVAAYVLATCGAAIFSGYRQVVVVAVVNLIAVVALARLTIDGFASAGVCVGRTDQRGHRAAPALRHQVSHLAQALS
jgi:hypothetical protein